MKYLKLLFFASFLAFVSGCNQPKIKQGVDMGVDDVAEEKLELEYVEDVIETYDKRVIKFKLKMPKGSLKKSVKEYNKSLSKSGMGANIDMYFNGTSTESLEELEKEGTKWDGDVVEEKKELKNGLLLVVKSPEYDAYSVYFVNKDMGMQVAVSVPDNRLEIGKEIAISLKPVK